MTAPEEPLDLLRQRVDALELSSQEKRKPWYRQASTLLSVIALLFSGYSLIVNRNEAIRTRKEELRKLVVALADTRRLILRANAPPESPERQTTVLEQIVNLQAARNLVSHLPSRDVSPYEYRLIAEELLATGEYAAGEDYSRKAVDAATSNVQKSETLLPLGLYYFAPGPSQDFAKGRTVLGHAIDALKTQVDPAALDLVGKMNELWAQAEFQNGFIERGMAKLNEARMLYGKLPANYPNRPYLLNDIDSRVKQPPNAQQSAAAFWPARTPPEDVRAALTGLTTDDIDFVVQHDMDENGIALTTKGGDKQQTDKEKRTYDRLASSGLVSQLSPDELKAEGRKAGEHYSYGIRGTALYPKAREYLLAVLVDTVVTMERPR
jgi:hypothetical protein